MARPALRVYLLSTKIYILLKDSGALTARKSITHIYYPRLKTLGYIVRLLQSRGHTTANGLSV